WRGASKRSRRKRYPPKPNGLHGTIVQSVLCFKSASRLPVIMFKSFPFKIYLVALALRLIPVLAARGLGIGLDDMFQYDMLARSLAQGHGFRWYAEVDLKQLASFVDFDLSSAREYDPLLGVPTSFRAPLYPFF